MKFLFSNRPEMCVWLMLLMFGLGAQVATAFPPAPHHVIYGMARDEWGNPLNGPATVILETASGTILTTEVVPGLDAGINYELEAPMDSGVAQDLYKATALRPAASFRIRVRIGNKEYLPIQMLGDPATLGEPAGRTRFDLTLGEDADGDGLPDAWERTINSDISKVGPKDDSDSDGLNNLEEYVAGTYAFDPDHGFALEIVGFQDGSPLLRFTAVRGRSYRIVGSYDLSHWESVEFVVSDERQAHLIVSHYVAEDIRMLDVQVVSDGNVLPRFFRLETR